MERLNKGHLHPNIYIIRNIYISARDKTNDFETKCILQAFCDFYHVKVAPSKQMGFPGDFEVINLKIQELVKI
jgi:hypothetical protein